MTQKHGVREGNSRPTMCLRKMFLQAVMPQRGVSYLKHKMFCCFSPSFSSISNHTSDVKAHKYLTPTCIIQDKVLHCKNTSSNFTFHCPAGNSLLHSNKGNRHLQVSKYNTPVHPPIVQLPICSMKMDCVCVCVCMCASCRIIHMSTVH